MKRTTSIVLLCAYAGACAGAMVGAITLAGHLALLLWCGAALVPLIVCVAIVCQSAPSGFASDLSVARAEGAIVAAALASGVLSWTTLLASFAPVSQFDRIALLILAPAAAAVLLATAVATLCASFSAMGAAGFAVLAYVWPVVGSPRLLIPEGPKIGDALGLLLWLTCLGAVTGKWITGSVTDTQPVENGVKRSGHVARSVINLTFLTATFVGALVLLH